jgi:hypothetical protein
MRQRLELLCLGLVLRLELLAARVQLLDAVLEFGGGRGQGRVGGTRAPGAMEVLGQRERGHALDRDQVGDRLAAEGAALLAHDHQQGEHVLGIRQGQADACVPEIGGGQGGQRGGLEGVGLVGR